LDEKTGKSYLFFLIEDKKRIGVEGVFFFSFLKKKKRKMSPWLQNPV